MWMWVEPFVEHHPMDQPTAGKSTRRTMPNDAIIID
jgi:hypothetical protein